MSNYIPTFFTKIKEIVRAVNGKMSGEGSFYRNAKVYWSHVPATIDGVLGGFGHISDTDLEGSRAFLGQVLNSANPPDNKRALDCGAGIGRITKNILIDLFDKVDMVEQDEKFANAALKLIGENNQKLGSLYRTGLQDFTPENKYDVIWIQWVLGHLNDDDMCSFLIRCREALNPNGVIFIKENVSGDAELEFDEEDSSVTRPYELIMKILEVAQLRMIRTDIQEGFPDDIYAVHMFAVVPMQDIEYDIENNALLQHV